MNTKITKNIDEISEVIKNGGVAVFPTETFYGIGCKISSITSVEKIANLKGSRDNKPFPLIAGSINQIKKYFLPLEKNVINLLKKIGPQALTIILPLKSEIIETVSNKIYLNGKSAVRISELKEAREIALACGEPMISTSANLSNKPPPQTVEELDQTVINTADIIFDGGKTNGGKPSTIIEFTKNDEIKIIRNGAFDISKIS